MIIYLFLQLIMLVVLLSALAFLLLNFTSGLISNFRGAPYVPMKRTLVHSLLSFGELSSEDIFYDLGSGNGQLLQAATREFKVLKALGYEAAPWPYLLSRWKTRKNKQVFIFRQSFFDADLSRATFVYMYLFPKLVDRLTYKLEQELIPGAKVLCPSFPIDIKKHPQFLLKKEAKVGTITAYLYEKI
jgi:hypothetical protein